MKMMEDPAAQENDGFFDVMSDREKKEEYLKIAQASAAFKTIRELCHVQPDYMNFILAVIARTATDCWSTEDPNVMEKFCVRGMGAIAEETKKRIEKLREGRANDNGDASVDR
jgi:hypothetical protein